MTERQFLSADDEVVDVMHLKYTIEFKVTVCLFWLFKYFCFKIIVMKAKSSKMDSMSPSQF